MELRIKKTHPNAIIPMYATEGSGGLDLSAALETAVTILPGEMKNISTGIAIELPMKNMVALMFPRSSIAVKHGVSLANTVGVIDSDYRGTIGMALINNSNQPFRVENGDRLVQLLIVSTVALDILEVDELSDTARGVGGFGSTGTRDIKNNKDM